MKNTPTYLSFIFSFALLLSMHSCVGLHKAQNVINDADSLCLMTKTF